MEVSLESPSCVRVRPVLTHGLPWLSNITGWMGNATDDQEHLFVKSNITDAHKQSSVDSKAENLVLPQLVLLIRWKSLKEQL